MASIQGHADIVSLLLKANADPNLQSKSGSTPLMPASARGCSQIVQLLLTSGADPNLQATYSLTALMFASHAGCLDSVKLLLKYGADPSIVASDGKTALRTAANLGHKDIVCLLQLTKHSQSSTSPSGYRPEKSASIDEVMVMLKKGFGQSVGEKNESFITSQHRMLERILPSRQRLVGLVTQRYNHSNKHYCNDCNYVTFSNESLCIFFVLSFI